MQLTRGHYLALGSTLIIVLWMLTGVFKSSDLEIIEVPVIVQNSDIFNVEIEHYQAKPITPELIIHGQTAANRQVRIKSEIAGRVIKVHSREGQFVKKGQVIIEIDPRDSEQQLAQAKALLKQRKLEHEANQSLIGKGLQNKTRLAESESLLAAANAQVTAKTFMFNASKITAPFSGVLEDRHVEVGSYLKIADPVISLLDYNPFIVRGFAAEKDLTLIKAGNPAKAKTIDGLIFNGIIRYVSSSANDASRTFAVELEIENTSERQANGLTAEISIPLQPTSGIFISPALLTLDDKGILGAKYVTKDNQVMFKPVKLIKAESTGVWISGLPNPVDLIVVGQSFVSTGEKVNPVTVRPVLSESELHTAIVELPNSEPISEIKSL
ncbi:MAG: multidrug efflux system membrane fusion protein [Bermanella sp.]|jgi:multidrug efflux system membrane fusion protein